MQKNITRVEAHTRQKVNDQIRAETDERIAHLSKHPSLIPARLRELDREWDIERTLETGASTLSLTGLNSGFFSQPSLVALAFRSAGVFSAACPAGLVSTTAPVPPFGNSHYA